MLRKTISTAVLLFILCSKNVFAQAPGNDLCASATNLTPVTSCGAITGQDLYLATSTGSPTSSCGTTNDVWYKFTVPSGTTSVTISATMDPGNTATSSNTYIEAFNASTCGSVSTGTSLGCLAVSSSTTLSVTPSTIYYFRVFTTASTGGNSSKYGFSICVTYTPPPANDDCSGATTLTSGTSCSNTAGTIVNALASTGLPAGCQSGGTHYDVWYKFVASNTTHTVTLSGQGSNFTNPEIQLYSGSCGSLTSLICGTTSVSSSSLTVSNTYYIRVSNVGSSLSTNGGFNICVTHPAPPLIVVAGRMNEVYKQTILSGSGALLYPWDITYGPDNNLWITESRGYKVYKMDPNTGTKTTVLDLNSASTDLSAWGADSLRAVNLTSTSNWNTSANAWPQGGLAGLAIHPKFMDGSGLYDFVYISYVHRYLSTASGSAGIFFRNKIVRFTYNSGTGKLGSPVVVCDTIPGGQDHNSQRMIIAPVTPGGQKYLFYAAGDMGAGQFANRMRPNNAQNPNSYEGKILRFNLESDGDAGANAWIPNDNPYNSILGVQSAVYSIGIRNNQGFAYDSTLNVLYGASHGPYSDDEINIIQAFKNYGHPLIEGFVDGNYDGSSVQGTDTSVTAGAPYTDNGGVSTCPPIGSEAANKIAINANGYGQYKDPLFSAYPVPGGTTTTPGTVKYIWKNNPGNANPAPGWPTEAWSGLDLYTNTLIPGWKNSLVAASLKWGRLVRLRLDTTGTATAPTNTVGDTISYFNSQNRFRDIAFSPDGKDIFVIMDNSSTTSGPGAANPVVPSCAGCVQKYTFLGYNDVSGKSAIPNSISVTNGTVNTCNTGTTVTIDNTNNTYWVPITGPDGNIMAEIYPNGNNLGTVTSSFYTNVGSIRVKNGIHYLDRNITITPQFQPSSTVKIRLYFSKAEYDALDADPLSGITSLSDVRIRKNSDACSSAMSATTTVIIPTFAEAHGTDGYVVQGDISSFSTFYISGPSVVLPLQLLTFSGTLKNNAALLKWVTTNEVNTSNFVIERSIDGIDFKKIGTVTAKGNTSSTTDYYYTDYDAANQISAVVYYRLKMVDINDNFSYSQVVSVTFTSFYTMLIYPNPSQEVLYIHAKRDFHKPVTIELYNLNGRLIKQQLSFSNDFTIDVSNLKSGVYMLKMYNSSDLKVQFEKIIKQ